MSGHLQPLRQIQALFKGIKPVRLAWIALVMGPGFLNPMAARASAAPNLRPAWGHSAVGLEGNASYLSDRGMGTHDGEIQNKIFDRRATLQMRQTYEDMSRDYEMRRKYGLSSLEERRAQIERMQEFSVNLSRAVGNYQLKEQLDPVRARLQRSYGENSIIEAMKKPFIFLAALYAAYSGQPVDMPVSENTRIKARTSVPEQRADLSVTSPYLNGSVGYVRRALTDRDPFGPMPDDPVQREERYSVGISRGIPYVNLGTALAYGGTTGLVTASVSKQLTQNLACMLGTSKTTKPTTTGITGEQSVRLQYGINF